MMIDKAKFLEHKGWHQWYNNNYWVHEQFGSESTDYTNHGFSLEDAYKFETEKKFKEEVLRTKKIMKFFRSWLSIIHKNEVNNGT